MSLLNAAYRWFEHPHRFLALRELGDSPTILDVGCGNHSPTLTKKYFPGATYHGVANEEWNLDARDRELVVGGDPSDYRDDVSLSRFIGDVYHDATGALGSLPVPGRTK